MTATAAIFAPRAASSAHAQQAQPSAQTSEYLAAELSSLTSALNDTAAPQEARDEAARRLVSRGTPDALKTVEQALENLQNPGGQLAAARALGQADQPVPEMINPLFATLGTNRPLTEASARALANYKSNPEVLTRLVDFVSRRPPADPSRFAVISAIGSIPTRRSAEFLVSLLQNPDESGAIRDAAGQALFEMTAVVNVTGDPAFWIQWWSGVARKSEAEFRADLLVSRSARFDRLRQSYERLTSELATVLAEEYRKAAPAARLELLQQYLRSTEPQVRAAGAHIVRNDALDNKPPAGPVREQLRAMIGDSSTEVRVAVASALATINDAEALEPLLAQLSIEPDPAVRAQIARALAPINDTRAVPVLLAMLNDPSIPAARAAAEALKQLGAKLRDSDPAEAQTAATQLRDVLQKRATTPDAADFREDLVDAMVPLRQPELAEVFRGLLDGQRGEGPEVRRLALRGLGELRNTTDVAVFLSALEDPSERVRLEAVQALAQNPALADNTEPLRRRIDPQDERDESVRAAAWNALLQVFAELPPAQLQVWSDRLKSDPARRQWPLKALAEQQLKSGDEDGLATTRHDLGSVLMELGEYREAAECFGLALEYKKARNVGTAIIDSLLADRLKALLLAKDFAGAVGFAASTIAENGANQTIVGPLIKDEAERLRENGASDAAQELIAAAKTMQPPLNEKYQDALAAIQKSIEEPPNKPDAPGSQPGPRSAVSTPSEPTSSTASSDR